MEEKIYKIEIFVKSITKDNGEKFKVYSTKINGEADVKNYVKINLLKMLQIYLIDTLIFM